MLARWARICLILITVFVLSIYLPNIYWKAFEETSSRAFIQYSPVINKFVIMKWGKDGLTFYDSDGNSYSRYDYDRLLPLQNARQLIYEGEFPDSLRGKKLEIEEVRLNDFRIGIEPAAMTQPASSPYQLMESQSGRAKLEYSDVFFRLDDRMEIIRASTNSLDEQLTEKFTRALNDKDFQFPAIYVSGNPTTRKPFDEGYFIIDSNQNLFHVKMVRNQPAVAKAALPEGMKVAHIDIREFTLREFYGLLITTDNECYLIGYDGYKFMPLPIPSYGKESDELTVYGNLFFRNVIVNKDSALISRISDRSYQPIASYKEKFDTREQSTAGVVARYLFPFETNLRVNRSRNIGLYVRPPGWSSAASILFFLVLTLFFVRNGRNGKESSLVTILVVLFTGIYGFLAVLLFRPIHRKF